MLQAYLDESGTDPGSPAMCVAGVLYERKGLLRLNREWKKELESAGIECFHTVDCAHRRGEFEGKPKEFGYQLYPKLIKIITTFARGTAGVYATDEDYDAKKWGLSPYAACGYVCMQMLGAIANNLRHKEVSFHIEAGHENMGELASLIRRRRQAGWSVVANCTFEDKALRPLQTADVLAYELSKRMREILQKPRKLTPRKSLKPLVSGKPEVNRITGLGGPKLHRFFAGLRDA